MIEPLESRIAPAVMSTFAAGLLNIIGDSAANMVTITEQGTPGAYHVDGLDAGQTADFTDVLSISVNLRDGTDQLTFNGSSVAGTVLAKDLSVSAKDALSIFINDDVNIGGKVLIDHAGGGQGAAALTVSIRGTLTVGELSIHDGNGSSTVDVGNGAYVLRGVDIQGGGGQGNDAAHFDAAVLGGSLIKTDAGQGSDQLSINNSRIGGSVTFTASSDGPTFSVQTNSAVKGPINLAFAGGGASSVALAGALGPVNITSGAGDDDVTFGAAKVAGKVKLNLGGGSNTVKHGSGETGGSFTVSGTDGQTSLTLNNSSRIYGTVSVTDPLATFVSVTLSDAVVGGKLSMTSGTGGDSLTATTSTVVGGIVAKLGAGANNVNISGFDATGGVTVISGADADTINANGLNVGGTFAASLGDGANTVTLAGSVGGLKVTTGAAGDTLTLRDLFVRGATAISSGAGDDKVDVANGFFNGSFKFLAGLGSNTFDIERELASNDGVSTYFFGSLTYSGGADQDTVVLGLDRNDSAIIVGTAKFTGGPGVNALNDDFLFAFSKLATQGFTVT